MHLHYSNFVFRDFFHIKQLVESSKDSQVLMAKKSEEISAEGL